MLAHFAYAIADGIHVAHVAALHLAQACQQPRLGLVVAQIPKLFIELRQRADCDRQHAPGVIERLHRYNYLDRRSGLAVGHVMIPTESTFCSQGSSPPPVLALRMALIWQMFVCWSPWTASGSIIALCQGLWIQQQTDWLESQAGEPDCARKGSSGSAAVDNTDQVPAEDELFDPPQRRRPGQLFRLHLACACVHAARSPHLEASG